MNDRSGSALKAIPLEQFQKKDDPKLKDGDGGGDGGSPEVFIITVASNGFILNMSSPFEEDPDFVEVHKTIDEVFDSIKKVL